MSATYIGPAPKDNMNHAAPTLCIKAPISEMTFAIRNWRNIGTCNGRHRLVPTVIDVRCRSSPRLLSWLFAFFGLRGLYHVSQFQL